MSQSVNQLMTEVFVEQPQLHRVCLKTPNEQTSYKETDIL